MCGVRPATAFGVSTFLALRSRVPWSRIHHMELSGWVHFRFWISRVSGSCWPSSISDRANAEARARGHPGPGRRNWRYGADQHHYSRGENKANGKTNDRRGTGTNNIRGFRKLSMDVTLSHQGMNTLRGAAAQVLAGQHRPPDSICCCCTKTMELKFLRLTFCCSVFVDRGRQLPDYPIT